jgi:sec-independent protein translocase protein TatA
MGLENPIHILIILVVLLLLFGAKRLPELGRGMGSGLRGFKDGLTNPEGHEAPQVPAAAPAPPAAEAAAVPAAAPAPTPAVPATPEATSAPEEATRES